MAAKRRTRKRKLNKREQRKRGTSPHPGVIIFDRERTGGVVWLARWKDPIRKRFVEKSLTEMDLTNESGRRSWAIEKSQQLAAQRQAISLGRVAATGPSEVGDAVDDFLARAKGRLRESTIVAYRESLDLFGDWAVAEGIVELRAVDLPALMRLRDWLVARPRTRARSGNAEGTPRSIMRVNRDVAAIKTFLLEMRRHGRVPRLDSEAIGDALKKLRREMSPPEFLRPAELRALLEAALRHDAVCFKMTRDEKGAGPSGETRKFRPIAPLILTTLLTGCRISELLSLPWARCHLDGTGELFVTARVAKTAKARAIDLSICPMVKRLLSRLRLASGGAPFVFGGNAPLAKSAIESARKRLVRERKGFGAPVFDWQVLRSSCATYATNASGVFGSSSAFHSARRLGHSVVVAERDYVGLLPNLPRDASTLEATMGIEDLAARIAGDTTVAPSSEVG